jgi:RimJ/RimL family protein N-acetyltransferase
MIGIGGCHKIFSSFGWPVVGYMLRKEFWGQGLATEFLHAWLDMWRKLPRTEAEIDVDPRTLLDGDGLVVPEQMTSFMVADNFASQRVLVKGGFEHFLNWREPDLRNLDVDVDLRGFRYFPTKHIAN